MTKKTTTRPTSDRQLAANKKNATKSTGPKTRAGKRKSASNATTHGIYSKKLTAITRGPLAERQHEVEELMHELIDALDPRDALEELVAREVAFLQLKRLRLERYEAEAVAGATRPGPHEHELGLERLMPLRALRSQLFGFMHWVEGHYEPDEDPTALAMVMALEVVMGSESTYVEGVWGEEVRPLDEDGWFMVLGHFVVSHFDGDGSSAAAWAYAQIHELDKAIGHLEGRAEELAASRAINGPMPTVLDLAEKLDRQQDRALARYLCLKDRELGG